MAQNICTDSRTRANYRRLSIPLEANPIIRNETASFHSLVQTHLFVLRSRARARERERKREREKRRMKGDGNRGMTRVEVGPRGAYKGLQTPLSPFPDVAKRMLETLVDYFLSVLFSR